MDAVARWLLRASYALFGLTAAFLLLVIAVEGYWGLFFPFVVVVGLWVWWVRRLPPDFR